MIKYLLSFIFLVVSLYAKDTCYSVQLLSSKNSISSKNYPDVCKVMKIGSSYTLRCGCFVEYKDAKDKLSKFLQKYKNSMIVTTYKYRFDTKDIKKEVVKTKVKSDDLQNRQTYIKKDISKDDSELRLILQIFLYKGDLENGYRVALFGAKKYPNSYYWNEKVSKIARWTNRLDISMRYLTRVYEITNDKDIEEQLIKYGILNRQYEKVAPFVLKRLKRDYSAKNIDLMMSIYKKIGVPEKILYVLNSAYKHSKINRKLLLTKSLKTALEMGNLDDAKRYVEVIEGNDIYDKEEATLLSKYYYIKKDIPKAYSVLVDRKSSTDERIEDIVKFYELKSDLGWYLQKNLQSAKASKKLMDLDKARLVDYERISFVYKDIDKELAMKAVRDGFKKYKVSYLFYSYANDAINRNKFKELKELIKLVKNDDASFVNDSLFWVIKAKIYGHYKQRDLEEEALLKALSLSPDDLNMKISLMWHFISIHDNFKLKILLLELDEDDRLNSNLYFPIASAYFYLHNINRASYFMEKILLDNTPMVNSQNFKFLQAYIYQVQNRTSAFKRVMNEIILSLEKQAKDKPRLWTNSDFLSTYLRAGLNVFRNKKFEKKLKKFKKYLDKKAYTEIRYSYAVKIGALELSRKIYNKAKHKELWIYFNNVLLFKDHSKIENMLDLYLENLSVGDAVKALQDDGQIALAQSFNFESFNQNSYNQNMYIRHLSLSKIRDDMFWIKYSYSYRTLFFQNILNIKNQTYLGDSYYMYIGTDIYRDRSLDETKLMNLQTNSFDALFGLKKIYDKGEIGFNIEHKDSISDYFAYTLYGSYKMTSRIILDILFGKSIDAIESNQLLLAGKKDKLSFKIKYKLLNSTSIDLLYEKNKFYSSNDVVVGNGRYTKFSISKVLKSGYPNILLGAYYDRGLYEEIFNGRGDIEKIDAQHSVILPRNYYNYGVNLSYGMVNANIYTRVWRPFFNLSTFYNSDSDAYSYGVNAGYGGKVWNQDHLVFGSNYSQSVSGIGGSSFSIFLDYKFLYE